MSDSEAAAPVLADSPVPALCQVVKEELDKCIQDKGEGGCQDLLEAFQACLKTATEAS